MQARIYQDCDLKAYPVVDPDFKPDTIILGDLHSNPMVILHALVITNAIHLSKEDYEELAKIYYRTPLDSLSASDFVKMKDTEIVSHFEGFKKNIGRFKTILSKIEFTRPIKIILIGDELHDRGRNDLYMLYAIKYLCHDLTILLSNHTAEFYKQIIVPKFDSLLHPTAYRSYINFSRLFSYPDEWADNLIKEALEIVHDNHRSALKLLHYHVDASTSPPTFYLYSHAPVGLETVQALAEYYEVEYSEDDTASLAKVIDEINKKFYAHKEFPIRLEEQNKLATIFFEVGRESIPTKYTERSLALLRLTWNRGKTYLRLEPTTKSFRVVNTHGHEGPLSKNPNNPTESHYPFMINTDSNFAKGDKSKGTAIIFAPNTAPTMAFTPEKKHEKINKNSVMPLAQDPTIIHVSVAQPKQQAIETKLASSEQKYSLENKEHNALNNLKNLINALEEERRNKSWTARVFSSPTDLSAAKKLKEIVFDNKDIIEKLNKKELHHIINDPELVSIIKQALQEEEHAASMESFLSNARRIVNPVTSTLIRVKPKSHG